MIERKLGHTNKEMLQYCERIKKIVLSKTKVKVGKGKNIEYCDMLKYKTDESIINNIIESHNYYKKLYEEEMKAADALTNGVIQYRDYQKDIIKEGAKIIGEHGFLYLAMEVRTGKTLTSLGIAATIKSNRVLFVTKKKAISSIEADYEKLNPPFALTVINYESLHLVMDNERWDLIICDEAHSMGAFPKPSGRAELVAEVIRKYRPRVILLSGTPTPESYSQMYHQVYAIPNNPFREFKNFYRFCDKYVNVKQRKINGLMVNDYSRGHDSILKQMEPFTINYTQQEAGFVAETKEEILEVEMKESTYKLIKRLKSDLVIEGKEETILADTPVKLMMKVHQLCSGT
ncbi:MAG: DEAD/DEAH box helicase family protein, partial [Bacteroidota bacterium]